MEPIAASLLVAGSGNILLFSKMANGCITGSVDDIDVGQVT